MKKKNIFLVCTILLSLLVIIMGCAIVQKKGTTDTLFKGTFTFSEKPVLNNPVELTYSVITSTQISNASIEIEVPEGISIISGNPHWKGDLSYMDTVTIKLTIQILESGNYTIQGRVGGNILQGRVKVNERGAMSQIFLLVNERDTIIRNSPIQSGGSIKPTEITKID